MPLNPLVVLPAQPAPPMPWQDLLWCRQCSQSDVGTLISAELCGYLRGASTRGQYEGPVRGGAGAEDG